MSSTERVTPDTSEPRVRGRRALRRRSSPRRRRRAVAVAGRAAAAVVALAGLVGLVLTVLVGLGVCRVLVVASGSMAPALHPGDLVVARPVATRELRPGEVVTFSDASREGALVTHRVVSARPHDTRIEVVTRGDSNTGVERWDADPGAPVGLLTARVPAVGRLLQHPGPGGAPGALLGAPALVAAALALRRIWGGSRTEPEGSSGRRRSWLATAVGAAGLAGLVVSLTAAAFSSAVTNSSSLSSVAAFAPTGTVADSGLDAQVPVSWSSLAWATEYQVQWRTSGSGPWSASSWSSSTSTTVPGLTNNVSYEFQVRARDADGTGPWSGSVAATPRQWKAVSAGGAHTCAITVTGRAYCWGSNTYGQIGDGTTGVDRPVPVPVDISTGLTTTNVASISAGYYDTCAVTTAGRAYCWGYNSLGNLGDGTWTGRSTPTPVDTTTGLTTTNVASISAGYMMTCAVTTSGVAYCWGWNVWGALGNPAAVGTVTTPTPVDTSTGLTSVAHVSSGMYHACAVTTGGQLYCWGADFWGQLGVSSYVFQATSPALVDTSTGLSAGVASVSTGWYDSCAVTVQGQAYCWGYDYNGLLGDGGASAYQYSPTAVTTGTGLTATNVAAMSAGPSTTCALTTAGAVYCWGDSSSGTLGDGSVAPRSTPGQVSTATGLDGTNAAAVSVGGGQACALTTPGAGGGVSCWGANTNGQVGDSTTANTRSVPTPLSPAAIPGAVPGVPTGLSAANDGNQQVPLTFTGVAGATDYQARWRAAGSSDPWTTTPSTAASPLTATGMTNGTLYELQLRSHNSAGFGDWTPSVTATPLGPPTGITAQSGLETQVPVSWTAEPGATDYEVQWRALGSPSWTSTGWTTSTSVTVPGLANDTTYEFQVRARDGNGLTVWSASYQGTPRRWAQVSAGYDHTCAVTVTHRGYCWGNDDHGQLGDGTYGLDRLHPVPVDTTTGLTASNVAAIDAGTSFTCAVTTAGKAYCWGLNGNGQLGDGTTTERHTPTPVDTSTGLTDTGIASISAGQYHACAVTTGHDAYCWGADGSSQLGDGTATERHLPAVVDSSTGLAGNTASISAGSFHTCVVTTDYRAYCWGANWYGQLGDGTTTSRAVPTPVAQNDYFYPQSGAPYGTNVSVVSAGQYHTCATTTWSTAYCWGSNSYGQLGDTTTTDRWVPTAVDNSTWVIGSPTSISAGAWSTCAASAYSAVSCWGSNAQGQLGDGTTTERHTPTAIDTSTGFSSSAGASVSVGTWQTCAVTSVYVGATGYCWGLDTHGQLGDGTTTQHSSPVALDHTAIPGVPAGVSGLTTTSGQELQVPLTWSAASGAEDYQVRWRTYGAGSWTTLPSTTATSATVTGLTDRVGYEFQVRAHDAGGFSAWTPSATGSPGAPDVPVGVAADSGLDAQVRVSWTAVIGADEHQVQWRTDASAPWTPTAWTTSASAAVTGLADHTSYEFQVRARNSGGTTGWSGSVTAIPRQWAQVSVGSANSCAVTVSGRAYCWGHNDAGQIGDGTSGVDRLSPVPVDTTTGLTATNVASIAAGRDMWDGNSGHTCAVTKTGELYCWGLNNSGQLGDGTYTNQLTPTRVLTSSGLVTAKQVVGANGWTCAVSTGGQAFCWGHQWWGELGNGWSGSGATPIPVTTGTGLTTTNVASISAYGMQTCAVTTGGQAFCWGGNSNGSLGNGTLSTSSSVPAPVDTTTGLTTSNVAQVSVGWMYACALTTAGQAYCWGDNEAAQVGDGNWQYPANSPTRPVAVDTSSGLTTTNVAAVSASEWRTCALTTTGSVYCWGSGVGVGDGAAGYHPTPNRVDSSGGLAPGSTVQFDAGGNGGCAVTGAASGGTAYCWGGGLVGDGTTAQRNTPVALAAGATPDAPAGAPANLAATSGQGTQTPLTWDALAGATEYQVRWRVQGDPSWTTTGWTTATTTTVAGLTSGTTYEFQVRGHNAGGFGAWSSSVYATP